MGVLKVRVNGIWQDAVEPGPPGVRGTTGPPGQPGPSGARGAAGDTVPVGGLVGDHLIKVSDTDFDVGWSLGDERTGPILFKEVKGPFDGVNGGSLFTVELEARDYALMASASGRGGTGGKWIEVRYDGVRPAIPAPQGAYIRQYFNAADIHQAMATVVFDLTGVVAGMHTISLVVGSGGLTTDGYDYGFIALFPQPV